MPGLVMLGLIGGGSLAGSYILDAWEIRSPGNSTPTWAVGAASLASVFFGPAWMAALGVGAFVGSVLPGIVEWWQTRNGATQQLKDGKTAQAQLNDFNFNRFAER